MVIAHSLGFPRIGAERQMKFAVEAYWKGELTEEKLLEKGRQICQENWAMQAQAGLDLLPVGDFSWYDHVLDMTIMLGVIPNRYQAEKEPVSLTTYFQMARGQTPGGKDIPACEMTKWFDTNYHYIVPELDIKQNFTLSNSKLFNEIIAAHKLGYRIKPVLVGPLTYLWLSKCYPQPFDKLILLPRLIVAYQAILSKLQALQIEWVQIDEPILVLDLPLPWKNAFLDVYKTFESSQVKILLASYFGGLEDKMSVACQLPIAGLHIDAVRAPEQIPVILEHLRPDCILSLGIVNGRNIWKTDLRQALNLLQPLHQKLQNKLWIGGSCSFLHSPVDLDAEKTLDTELKQWLAFSKQKTAELADLAKILNNGEESMTAILAENQSAMQAKASSQRIHNPAVKQRCNKISELNIERTPYPRRREFQQKMLALPLLPTTTIGSFPQTSAIRKLRQDLKTNTITTADYAEKIRQEIRIVVEKQIELGLDVLVHGEAERNDMVEYFGEQLAGFAFTQNGWVQSYGSRCVKPPIIYGDVSRPHAMTVAWSVYAQSLTDKPMKGMLTGPVTIIMWSFVRDDQPRYQTTLQVALALRDEVKELEQAGIKIIQIDEPAFREGLPLRRSQWAQYLEEAIKCFKLTASCVEDSTQIHTHMCYSEFNDIIAAIAKLDADVISIETSRSHMELLEAFKNFSYPNEIGPGVYDIHSPRVPTMLEIIHLIDKAATLIPAERLWINPDCGLKTRNWAEVEAALKNMVKAAYLLREKYKI
jgi:5-methyltetrahydropteroyltriglutamate--homocysteine methyltransferase